VQTPWVIKNPNGDSPNQQEIIKMRFYDELTFKEIAELTNTSINTTLGRMRYALMNIRKIIAENKIVLTS